MGDRSAWTARPRPRDRSPSSGPPAESVAAGDPDARSPARGIAPHSVLAVPLCARGHCLGVIALAIGEGRSPFGPEEVSLARDLAGRAAIAIDNARLYRDVQENNRRKNEFLAMLAHELRNPLAPIRNAAEILRMLNIPDTNLLWASDVIGRQVEHLVRLVDDLLDISRITGGKIQLRIETVDAAVAVSRAVETSRPLIDSRRHELNVDLPAYPILVKADLVRLSQVLSNLLNNAAKYTEEGGRIDLEVTHEAGEVVFRVGDNGIGITPEMLPRIFDLFTQVDRSLDRSQGGLGVGLTLVRQLVEMHGGTVRVHSDGPNCGSVFVVRLPAMPPSNVTASSTALVTPPGELRHRGRGLSVLGPTIITSSARYRPCGPCGRSGCRGCADRCAGPHPGSGAGAPRTGLIVVRVPEPGRRHERRARLPVGTLGVDDVPILVEIPADQRIASGLAIDDQVEGDRLVMVRELNFPLRQHAEHRPDDVSHRSRLGELLVREQDAHAAPLGGLRVLLDDLQLRVGALLGIERRPESRGRRLDAQVSQQGLVVHPVEGRIRIGVVRRPGAGGQREDVALLPGEPVAVDLRPAGAPDHEVELGRRIGARPHVFARLDVDEIGTQGGAGRRPGASQFLAQVERDDAGRALFVQPRREIGQGHLADQPGTDRIGRLAVLVVLSVTGPSIQLGGSGLPGDGHGYPPGVESADGTSRGGRHAVQRACHAGMSIAIARQFPYRGRRERCPRPIRPRSCEVACQDGECPLPLEMAIVEGAERG